MIQSREEPFSVAPFRLRAMGALSQVKVLNMPR